MRRQRTLKLLVAAGLALGLAASMSGCFLMRTLSFTKDAVQVGHRTTVVLSSAPASGKDTPFYLFDTDSAAKAGQLSKGLPSPLKLTGGKFDTQGIFPGTPVKLTKDQDLMAVVAANSECQQDFMGGVSDQAVAFRTRHPVNADAKHKNVTTHLSVKALQGAHGVEAFVLGDGTWSDDGDGIPEDSEVFCQNRMFTTVRVK
jgi:hypothetical protein